MRKLIFFHNFSYLQFIDWLFSQKLVGTLNHNGVVGLAICVCGLLGFERTSQSVWRLVVRIAVERGATERASKNANRDENETWSDFNQFVFFESVITRRPKNLIMTKPNFNL